VVFHDIAAFVHALPHGFMLLTAASARDDDQQCQKRL
jgi:hypothetical protein